MQGPGFPQSTRHHSERTGPLIFRPLARCRIVQTLRPWALVPKLLVVALAVRATFPAAAAIVPADSKITAVTVYTDRAVVGRTAIVDLPAGTTEVVFARLPATLLDRSLQVSGKGAAAATILDVTGRATYIDFTPNERVQHFQEELRALGQQKRILDDHSRELKAREASLSRIEAAATQPPTKEAPRLSLDEAGKLLDFLQAQRTRFAAEKEEIDVAVETLTAHQDAVQKQLDELRGAGGRSFKNVTVRLSCATAGPLELRLKYEVPAAHWSPSYDARVVGNARVVELGYFGVVQQNTGEDWTNVELTLSTARPSLGGGPSPLPTWWLDNGRRQRELAAPVAMKTVNSIAGVGFAEAAAAPGQAGDAEGLDQKVFAATLAQAEVALQATSASFRVPASSTILSDNTPQKVPVTALRLDSEPEYRAIPKQIAAAFLHARVTNASAYPLLQGVMNVYLDDAFVASSTLRTVMAGEKFELALGADEGISVRRQLNRRFTEDTGLLTKGQRITYDYMISVENHKAVAETLIVTDQVPLSRDEKIAVRLLAPDAREVKTDPDGSLQWTLVLKPGEKRQVPLRFAIDFPADATVLGVN